MLPGKQYTPEIAFSLLRRRVWYVLVPVSIAAAGTVLWSRNLPDLYRSQAVIQVIPQSISESLVRSTIEARIEDRLPAIQQAIQSRTRLESMIEEFDLYPQERQVMVMEDVVERMRADIQTWIVRRDAFGVSYVGTDPEKVMRVTDRLGGLFIEQSLSYRHNLTEVTDEFLDSQLLETRQALESQEGRLESYRRTYAGQLPTQVEANLQQMSAANMQLQQIVDGINQAMSRRLVLERQLGDLQRAMGNGADAVSSVTSAGLQASVGGPAGELAAAQEAVEAVRARGLKPGHPDLDAALRSLREAERRYADAASSTRAGGPIVSPAEAARQAQLDAVKAEIAELDRQVRVARENEARLRGVAEAAQARLDAMPTRETEMIALMRDYDIINDKYRGLLQKREEARISANLERRQVGEQFNIIDRARLAERPFSPDRFRLNMAGAAFGLVFGVGLIGFLEYRDRGLRTDEDVRSVVGLPVLAVVPVMMSDGERRRRLWRRAFVNFGLGSLVTVCLAVCVYVYVSS
jgi:polysaccharide chain length determinant protein (PEP-CTERM system associated)